MHALVVAVALMWCLWCGRVACVDDWTRVEGGGGVAVSGRVD